MMKKLMITSLRAFLFIVLLLFIFYPASILGFRIVPGNSGGGAEVGAGGGGGALVDPGGDNPPEKPLFAILWP